MYHRSGDTDSGGAYACVGTVSILYDRSLYSPLNFAVNLKLLKNYLKKKKKHWMTHVRLYIK